MINANSFKVQVNDLPGDRTDMAAYLSGLFTPNSNIYNQLKYEIEREYRFNGSPEVTAMRFDRISYNSTSGKGSFRVVLDINFTFGCEDVRTEKEDQTSEWTFEVNKDTHTIQFSGSPYVDSRSTADEF
jgi:hypothetical protein